MFKHYAKIGESFFQTLLEDAPAPEGFIEMLIARPESHYVATESGEWVEPEETEKEFKHFDVRDFFKLFAPERVAIKLATTEDPNVGIWYDDALSAKYITYSDPDTVAGLAFLVQMDLLSQERHDEIVEILTAEKQD